MSEQVFHRLHKARENAGFRSAREAAENFGWSYSTYAAHESGARGIKPDVAKRYARSFRITLSWLLTGEDGKDLTTVGGVPLVGELAAGQWLEVDDTRVYDDVHIPAVPDPRFPIEYQVALRVRGPSMNRVMQDGSYAVGILYEHAPRRVQDGDIVAVRRFRSGLVETTLKRYRELNRQGALFPESDDPRYQDPVDFTASDEDNTVEIFALVIGNYRPFI